MKRVLLFVLLLLGCSRPPTARECDAMLDRYLDLTEDDDLDQWFATRGLAGVSGDVRAPLRAERIGERRASVAYLDAEKRCTAETTRAELTCAMKAPSANDWESCFDVPWSW